MGLQDFGELVRTLREDRFYYDDAGRRRSWTRADLARLTQPSSPRGKRYGLSENNIRDIENGYIKRLEPDVHLEPLAEAFALTEHQKVDFYSIAGYVYRRAKEQADLTKIKWLLGHHNYPTTAFTHLGDIIAFNHYIYTLYGHSDITIQTLAQGTIRSNILRVYFDPVFRAKEFLGGTELWRRQTIRNLLAFRAMAFPYIATERYQQIKTGMLAFPEFGMLWTLSEAEMENELGFAVDPVVQITHPEFGKMRFLTVQMPYRYAGDQTIVSLHIPAADSEDNYNVLKGSIAQNRLYFFND